MKSSNNSKIFKNPIGHKLSVSLLSACLSYGSIIAATEASPEASSGFRDLPDGANVSMLKAGGTMSLRSFDGECDENSDEDKGEEECESELPECNEGEGEEECEAELPECNEDEGEEECETELPECNEDEGEEECESELPECNEDEGEEECEAELPECNEDEGEEECEAEFPECNEDEGEEECEAELPECNEDEGEEECEAELPECNEDEGGEECESEQPECNEGDEGEENNCDSTDEAGTAQTGYQNPNPLADTTEMSVEKAAADTASRFLSQATLGADYPLITHVASLGEEVWLESQFNQPIGYLYPYTHYLTELNLGDSEIFGSSAKWHMHAWWTQVMTSPDLVRQRVALALNEIFVISQNVEEIGETPYMVSAYYDLLLESSFGNFRDLLKGISLNSAMAIYLSHLNNAKADESKGTFPDENFAREVMQLFTIGLFELNQDGTRKKDVDGNELPTYGQNEIREFAKIFTGLSYDSPHGFGFSHLSDEDYDPEYNLKPLKMFDQYHSLGEKHLLNGMIIPSGQSAMQDFEQAIDNLFNHLNVGPFIGKQLIQRLVKSNPSPAYIARVSAAFNGEIDGVRGDMKAVVRAILLDPEARATPNQIENNPGRLREPFLRLIRLARAFNATTPDRNYAGGDGYEVFQQIRQYPMNAPSVFNFFQPNYVPNGELKEAGLVAPEFQITTSTTIIEIKNLIAWWVESGHIEDSVGNLVPQSITFEQELAIASSTQALLNRIDTLLTYGTLTEQTRSIVRQVIDNEPDPLSKVRKAIYLIATSPDFAIAL